jgi:hypothetical protein
MTNNPYKDYMDAMKEKMTEENKVTINVTLTKKELYTLRSILFPKIQLAETTDRLFLLEIDRKLYNALLTI